MMNKTVLTIAGSDSSGGAGIQADLKVMTAHGVYGMSVITAVTAQNTLGVRAVRELEADMVCAQLDAVLSDIRPDAVKIGMVCSEEIIHSVARAIDRWELKNIVVDPVMESTSGRDLLDPQGCGALEKELFPRANLVTPNLPETERLCVPPKGQWDREAVQKAAMQLAQRWGAAFLIKGGHLEGEAADCCCTPDGEMQWYEGKRIDTAHTHGTGCTYSTAIACNLAKGMELSGAIREAKIYLEGAIRCNPGLGAGHGPLNHCWRMEGTI